MKLHHNQNVKKCKNQAVNTVLMRTLRFGFFGFGYAMVAIFFKFCWFLSDFYLKFFKAFMSCNKFLQRVFYIKKRAKCMQLKIG
jgi:hypothetical protein